MTQPTHGNRGVPWDDLPWGDPIIPTGAAPNNGLGFDPNDPRWGNDPSRRGRHPGSGGGGGVPTGGGGGGASTGGGMSGMDWAELGLGALEAYAGYRSGQQQNQNPRPDGGVVVTRDSPFGTTTGADLDYILNEARGLYQGAGGVAGGGGGRGRGGRGGGGGGGGRGGGGGGSRVADLYGDIRDMARAGNPAVAAGNDALQRWAETGSSPMLDEAFGAARDLNNPNLNRFVEEGFGGWNSEAQDMLRDFIGGGRGGGGTGPGGSARGIRGGGGGGGGFTGSGFTWRDNAPGMGGPGGALADAEMQAILGGQYLDEGNPHLAKQMENLRRESLEGFQQSVGDIDAAMSGSNRLGSSFYQNIRERGLEEYNEGVTSEISNMLSQNYEAERNRMLQTLGIQNERDAAWWNSQAQREGNHLSASASAYGADSAAGAQRQALQLQAIMGFGGMQLDNASLLRGAIGDQSGLMSARVGAMGDIGGTAGDLQMRGIGLIPGLDEARYSGYDRAVQVGGMADAQDAARRAQEAADRRWREGAAGRNLDDYLGRVLRVGGAGGTRTSTDIPFNREQRHAAYADYMG